jgi:hypothetical protein
MLDDYEQYEIECERIRESNGNLVADFEDWLRESNLADQTISKHVENIDFYINEYLLYEDAIEPQDGVSDAVRSYPSDPAYPLHPSNRTPRQGAVVKPAQLREEIVVELGAIEATVLVTDYSPIIFTSTRFLRPPSNSP